MASNQQSSAPAAATAAAAVAASPTTTPTAGVPQSAPPGTSNSSSSSSSSNNNNNNNNNGGRQSESEKISFHLKTGLFTRLVTLERDKLALGLVKQLAVSFLNEIYFQKPYPSDTFVGHYIRAHFASQRSLQSLYERLLLTHYNPLDETYLPFNSVSDIKTNSYINIDISERNVATLVGQIANADQQTTAAYQTAPPQHSSSKQQPQSANEAHLLMSSMSASSASSSSSSSHAMSSSTSSSNRSSNYNPKHQKSIESDQLAHQSPAAIDPKASATNPSTTATNNNNNNPQQLYQLKILHEFKSETYLFPTHCASCSSLIKGVFRQGFQCTFCKRNYCPKCKAKAEANNEACLAQIQLPPMYYHQQPLPAPHLHHPHQLQHQHQHQQQQQQQHQQQRCGNGAGASVQPPPASPMAQANVVPTIATSGAQPASPKSANIDDKQSSMLLTSSSASSSSGANENAASACGASNPSSSGSAAAQHENNDNSGKLEVACGANHANMSKRKSTNNLLHFNIANPFKSHHSSQQQQQQPQPHHGSACEPAAGHTPSGQHANPAPATTNSPSGPSTPKHHEGGGGGGGGGSRKVRGSAGALEPVLHQLSKMRDQQRCEMHAQKQVQVQSSARPAPAKGAAPARPQPQQWPAAGTGEAGGGGGGSLAVHQTAQLSSSHQNLFTDQSGKVVAGESCCGAGAAQPAGGGGNGAPTWLSPVSGSGGGGATGSGGSSSACQSPHRCGHASQLSSSVRTSACDLYQSSTSPTRREQTPGGSNHSFVEQAPGGGAGAAFSPKAATSCGVCSKPLQVRQAAAAAAADVPQQQSSSSQGGVFAVCRVCNLQVHAQCQKLALANCLERIAESSRAAAAAATAGAQAAGTSGASKGGASAGELGANQRGAGAANEAPPPPPQSSSSSPERRLESGACEPDGQRASVRDSSSNVSRDNIRLHRLNPSVKHVKRPDATKAILEGWLRHKTTSSEHARSHYWRLDDSDITLYENDTSTRYFKAISVANIQRVISANALPKLIKEDVLAGAMSISPPPATAAAAATAPVSKSTSKSASTSPTGVGSKVGAQGVAMFAFELSNGSVYFVQADDAAEATRWTSSLAALAERQRSASAADVSLVGVGAAPPTTTTTVEAGPASEVVAPTATAAAIAANAAGDATTPERAPAGQTPTHASTAAAAVAGGAERPARRQHHHAHHHHGHHGHHHAHHHHQAGAPHRTHKTYTDPNRSRLYNRPRITITLSPMSIPDHWIEGRYLIERDREKHVGFEELGSGQFGKVYAAISEIKAEEPSKGLWSGVPVAIKEISKARFDLRQQAKLKNEANILSRLDHPGVIILERVHDLADKIYIVMEQLEDDMLEMIVSTESKRLSERVTKFLTYQILEALKYLHAQNIAHCDLKPENVLLVERRSQFPQIKLCDFGFAKIIEENSFRNSLVGTPAYLAPEVVRGERYNRSVDLWSVGVIVYVSLSGEFPFNEGENIHNQISRANFMYPEQPWGKISSQAKSFINSLLRVNSDKRLSASRAQMDDWIQDYQLWCDLCELELRVAKRWVTDDADFERWTRYARDHNLVVPRSAVQLHEELLANQ